MKVRTSWLERIIVGICVAIAICGALAGYFYDPPWLNRAGSVIIVIGVIAASVRLQEVLTSQISRFREMSDEKQLQELYEVHERFFGRPLDAAYKKGLESLVNKGLETMFANYIERRVKRLKSVELSILIAGTLINGFGDLVVLGMQKLS
ncbi:MULTISPECIES: hypothetical protein [unclassified Pseudomonas]|uniref:hypothetical protein n=1 Tax=unclassified Pseudomonas TaxID=196821 RepID=UPI0006F43811|nr:hypothetical protein [Pseudomonas sp. Leaf434]KQT67845.1 hypothetical protein ASG55_08190 [Pseudomonas sp. Leaf434]